MEGLCTLLKSLDGLHTHRSEVESLADRVGHNGMRRHLPPSGRSRMSAKPTSPSCPRRVTGATLGRDMLLPMLPFETVETDSLLNSPATRRVESSCCRSSKSDSRRLTATLVGSNILHV